MNELETVTVNDKLKVKPLLVAKKKDTWPADKILDTPHGAVFMVATPNSGKTTLMADMVLNHLIKDPKKIKIIVFCGNVEIDPTWKKLISELKDKDVEVVVYESMYQQIYEGKKVIQSNNLQAEVEKAISEFKEYDSAMDKKKEAPRIRGGEPVVAKYVYRPRGTEDGEYLFKEKVFIIDDLSNELNDPYLDYFLKTARQKKCRVIMSTQDFKDISPSKKAAVQHYIVFKGLSEERSRALWEAMAMNDISFNQFKEIYANLTGKEKYDFMYYSKLGDLRRNFTDMYKVKGKPFKDESKKVK